MTSLDPQTLAHTAIDVSRAARSHAMDARLTKKPISQQLHTTAGLAAAKNSLATGDGNVFITAQCRIKSASAKDQRTTDPSLGQWGKPWSKDAYMSGTKLSCHFFLRYSSILISIFQRFLTNI